MKVESRQEAFLRFYYPKKEGQNTDKLLNTNALFFQSPAKTITNHEMCPIKNTRELVQKCYLLLNTMIHENLFSDRLSFFQNNTQLQRDYFNYWSDGSFDFVIFQSQIHLELISLVLNKQIRLYSVIHTFYLSSYIFNHQFENSLEIFHYVASNHYSNLYTKRKKNIQNSIQDLIQLCLRPKIENSEKTSKDPKKFKSQEVNQPLEVKKKAEKQFKSYENNKFDQKQSINLTSYEQLNVNIEKQLESSKQEVSDSELQDKITQKDSEIFGVDPCPDLWSKDKASNKQLSYDSSIFNTITSQQSQKQKIHSQDNFYRLAEKNNFWRKSLILKTQRFSKKENLGDQQKNNINDDKDDDFTKLDNNMNSEFIINQLIMDPPQKVIQEPQDDPFYTIQKNQSQMVISKTKIDQFSQSQIEAKMGNSQLDQNGSNQVIQVGSNQQFGQFMGNRIRSEHHIKQNEHFQNERLAEQRMLTHQNQQISYQEFKEDFPQLKKELEDQAQQSQVQQVQPQQEMQNFDSQNEQKVQFALPQKENQEQNQAIQEKNNIREKIQIRGSSQEIRDFTVSQKNHLNNDNYENQEEVKEKKFGGLLRYYDDGKRFGFISRGAENSDVFFYFDDIVTPGIDPKFLKTVKQGSVIEMQYKIQEYYGKYKKSIKAVDIDVISMLPYDAHF